MFSRPRMFSRFGIVLATAALGTAALVGVAACTPGTSQAIAPEEVALTALGYQASDVTPAADPSASPAATGGPKPGNGRALRRMLRGNVEHGEVVVKTKNGDKTVDVQRGTVTAVSGGTVTVRSADGFTLTWAYGSNIRVIKNRTKVATSAVTAGEQIGVAGTRSGSTVTAVLIVIPHT